MVTGWDGIRPREGTESLCAAKLPAAKLPAMSEQSNNQHVDGDQSTVEVPSQKLSLHPVLRLAYVTVGALVVVVVFSGLGAWLVQPADSSVVATLAGRLTGSGLVAALFGWLITLGWARRWRPWSTMAVGAVTFVLLRLLSAAVALG